MAVHNAQRGPREWGGADGYERVHHVSTYWITCKYAD